MSLATFWEQYRARRAKRYLQANHALAIETLRKDPALGAAALHAMFTLQAAQGGPERQTYQYPLFQSFGLGSQSPLSRTVAKPMSWQIRSFAEYPPSRRAINSISNSIIDLPYTISVKRPLNFEANDIEPPPTADQKRRITAATMLLERPNNEMSWREFLEMILEDLICLGAGPFEAADNTTDERPIFLWPVEAETLRINARWTPGNDTYRYSQSKAYAFGSTAGSDEVLLSNEQLCYPRLNPRAHTPFGLGYLEVALAAVNSYIGAFDYSTRKASNATPESLIFLGENVTIDQVRQWQHYWETEIEGMGKIPILGGGRQPTIGYMGGAGQDPLNLGWQEWIVRQVAMAFGLSPMKLALERDINRNTAETQSENDWETVAPVANTIKSACTHWLLWHRLGWTDLEFQWQVKTADELKQAEILAIQYEMDSITVNEIRELYDREPLDNGMGDSTKSEYETSVKTASAIAIIEATPKPEPPLAGTPGQRPPAKRQAEASAWEWSPFGDVEGDALSPREVAFVKALAKQQRHHRNGAVHANV